MKPAVLLLLGAAWVSAGPAAAAAEISPESGAGAEHWIAVVAGAGRLTVYGQPGLAERRYPPCSTFKIVSILMGLDCQVVTGPESRLGWDGARHENPGWNRDLTLLEAFRLSCVPYFRKLVGRLKREYVGATLQRLQYGNCDISVWNSNGHNVFWIESSLLISPVEQIGVLRKIFSESSPFAPEHVAMLKLCMSDGTVGNWTVYGKTGTGRNHNSDRLEAWYVGRAEHRNGRVVYFASHGADAGRNVTGPDLRARVFEILAGLP